MLYLDKKYAHLCSIYLKRYRILRDDLYNFRCPFCGDSKKNEVKARGYLFKEDDALFFKCWNCGVSKTMVGFLDFINPELAKEYKFEKLKESGRKSTRQSQTVLVKDRNLQLLIKDKKKPLQDKYDIILKGVFINKLPEDHPCRQYVTNRLIPKKYWNYLQYTDKFKDLVEDYGVNLKIPNDERLVIPVYNRNKELTHIQGRSLEKNPHIRYITVTVQKEAPKIFGLDNIIENEPKYVVEGPIDSMFIPNSIAVMDSCLHKRGTIPKEYTLIPDCQPRNKEIVNNMKSSIDLGYPVCMLPEGYGKDINEMILNGLTQEDLMDIIKKNTYQGLTAQMMFVKWRKV